jgi:hypothetical protein
MATKQRKTRVFCVGVFANLGNDKVDVTERTNRDFANCDSSLRSTTPTAVRQLREMKSA